ncbi:hypothetical protein O2W14_18850 [Modestobacter sp. VKM Ac-2986]|uniref:hypothetical protein n=1 Tax=Modestobacter sp. VKM Ac-2986 TaxID=3004140 RepID=UPI0022AB8E69|nr:hypothetical protein [Modestobacter sp. VKM Ac-2986]MCZ2830905.1 hypothetical protein [Modestobacter sp. VKM Ac-2986]
MVDRWWAGAPRDEVLADAHLLAAVDEALIGSGVSAELVCTSVDRSAGVPRTGVALRLTGEPADPSATRSALSQTLGGPVVVLDEEAGQPDVVASAALQAARQGTAGRCVRFPGQQAVRGRLPVADLVSGTAIDELVGVGVEVAPDAVVDTLGFLRPQWSGGRLTLLVEQGAGGVLRPFEIESPHECCGGAGH